MQAQVAIVTFSSHWVIRPGHWTLAHMGGFGVTGPHVWDVATGNIRKLLDRARGALAAKGSGR